MPHGHCITAHVVSTRPINSLRLLENAYQWLTALISIYSPGLLENVYQWLTALISIYNLGLLENGW